MIQQQLYSLLSHHVARRAMLLAGCALCCVMTTLHAQEPQPSDPAATASATALNNPAVRAAMELPRNTPSDFLQKTINLLDLGEPELAASVFRELVAQNLDDAAKAKLVEQLGAAAMLRLSRSPELGPDAATFIESAMAAVAAETNSAERIAALVTKLASDNASERQNAVSALAGAGQPSVVPLIQLLGSDQPTDATRQAARAALVRLGPLAEGPVLATLDSENPKLRAEAAEILAALGTPQAAALLAVPAIQGGSAARAYQQLTGQTPSIESAEGLLTRALKNLSAGVPVSESPDGTVTWWIWGAKPGNDQKPRSIELTVAQANTMYRAKLAKQLQQLRPNVPIIESEAVRLDIERAEIYAAHALEMGYDKKSIVSLSADSVDRILRDALKENQVSSAKLMLEVIATRRDPAVLATPDGLPSPTARALEHPHPSVRAAALDAIAAIDPPRPFPGASKVSDVIVELASASGVHMVAAGSPRVDDASTWAGGMTAVDMRGQVANIGADLLAIATTQADVEMVLVDMSIAGPNVRDVVFQLRRDPATGLVPIGLLARESQLSTARRIASEHERVIAFPRPHTGEALANVAAKLHEQLPTNWPTPEQRLAHGQRAIEVMNQFLNSGRNFYRLRSIGTAVAHTIRPAGDNATQFKVLAQLGTHESQVTLLAQANAPAADIAFRRAAAEAFKSSVYKFGLRLTSEEIVSQYDLYNASATQPKETQDVFGQILDTLEAGRKKSLPTE